MPSITTSLVTYVQYEQLLGILDCVPILHTVFAKHRPSHIIKVKKNLNLFRNEIKIKIPFGCKCFLSGSLEFMQHSMMLCTR